MDLLLAALANWFHYLMGAAGEIAGVHLRYQANTIKNRPFSLHSLSVLKLLLYNLKMCK